MTDAERRAADPVWRAEQQRKREAYEAQRKLHRVAYNELCGRPSKP